MRRKKTVSARCAREFEIKGKTKKKTVWHEQSVSLRGGEKKRDDSLVGAIETIGVLTELCKL